MSFLYTHYDMTLTHGFWSTLDQVVKPEPQSWSILDKIPFLGSNLNLGPYPKFCCFKKDQFQMDLTPRQPCSAKTSLYRALSEAKPTAEHLLCGLPQASRSPRMRIKPLKLGGNPTTNWGWIRMNNARMGCQKIQGLHGVPVDFPRIDPVNEAIKTAERSWKE